MDFLSREYTDAMNIACQSCFKRFVTQAEQPGSKFQLFFPRSVTNRRLGSTAHASLMHAYDTWNSQKLSSCKATSSNAMNSRAIKTHTNEHTVCGRRTLKVVKRFRKGSVCKAYERSTIYERTFWVNFNIKNHVMLCYVKELHCSYQPGLSTLHLDKKHLRSVIVFLGVTVNQVGSQHKLLTSVQQEKKG